MPQHLNKEVILSPDFIDVWESLTFGVIITDADATCLFMNRAQKRFDNFHNTVVTGRHIDELYPKTDIGLISSCIKSGAPLFNTPAHYETLGGLMVNSVVSAFPLSRNGKLDGTLSFALDVKTMQEVFSDAVKTSQHIKESQSQQKRLFSFDDLVGHDTRFLDAIERARAAQKSSAHVMIWGESGSGKELFAQAIHNRKENGSAPFIPVNCAAIPESLLEGILFGTSKGAFTGAMDKAGLFEVANGGTLFLDELNSMPMPLQAKILRAVQENRTRRVGSLEERRINVRIISALNADPDHAMKSGQLREDLFYRLAILMIHIPPLRDRKLDIIFLSQHFLQKQAALTGKRSLSISDEVYNMFLKYNWKGNVRELEHTILGASHLLSEETVINRSCLSPYFMSNYTEEMRKAANQETDYFLKEGQNAPDVEPLAKLKKRFQAEEMGCIKTALKISGGNIAEAARKLGISAPNLHYKLKSFGIEAKDQREEMRPRIAPEKRKDYSKP